MRYILLSTAIFSTACQDKSDTCFSDGDLDEGKATLSLDGDDYTYESTWMMTGSSLQLNLEDATSGSSMTIRLSQSDSGLGVDSLGEDFPYTFAIGVPANGTGTVYPPNASTSAAISADNPGLFTLDSFDGSTVTGCFEFTAEAQDGTSYEISSGLVYASESELN